MPARGALRRMVGLALFMLWGVSATLAQAGDAANGAIIHRIVISGLDHTRPKVVRRELPFAEGDRWRTGMAELARRRLLNLGLFSEAEVQPPDAEGRVRVALRERWSLWLLPQATRKDNGASSAGVALDEYNLWGLNHRLHLAWRKDTGRNFTGGGGAARELGYDWNRIGDSRWTLRLRVSQGERPVEAFRAGAKVADYAARESFASLELSRAFGAVPGEGWDAGVGLAWGDAVWRLVRGGSQPGFDPVRRRSVFANVSYRDVFDHVDWIEGERLAWSMAVTSRAWGSTLNSTRQVLAWARHARIGDMAHTVNVRIEAGAITGDVRAEGLFDLGNRNGLRGYYPGELLASRWLLGGVEGRWLFPVARNLQWVSFVETAWLGGVVESMGRRRAFVGAGAGLRWTLRWLVHGTLRLDVAWGFQSRRWRWYLGTGQAF